MLLIYNFYFKSCKNNVIIFMKKASTYLVQHRFFCNLHLLFVLSKFHAININQLERMMLVYSVNTCQNKKSGVLELDSFQIASIVFYMNTLDKKSIKNEKQLRIAQGQRMRWISLSYCIPKWIQFTYVYGENKRMI